MAVTDDERRRVAMEVRGLRRNGHNVTQLNHGPTWSIAWCVLGDELGDCVPQDWFERMCARLADLIDPDCDGGRYEGVRTARSVDRGALLALAGDVDGAADDSGGFEPLAGMLRDIARRIREACGEGA